MTKAKTRDGLGRALLIAGVALSLGAGALEAVREARDGGALAAGAPAPALLAPSLGGSPFALESLRGKVVLLSFFATWCEPCRAEMPMLRALEQELGPRGLSLVAANVDDDSDDRPQALADFFGRQGGAPPLVVFPPDEAVHAYQAAQLPTLYVIGRDGRIAAGHFGLASEKALRREVETALAAPPPERR